MLNTKITDIPQACLEKYAKGKVVKKFKSNQLVNKIEVQKTKSNILTTTQPTPQWRTASESRVEAKARPENKPRIREIYGSFSPKREARSGSVPKEHLNTEEVGLNICRISVNSAESPFHNQTLKTAFKNLTSTITQKQDLINFLTEKLKENDTEVNNLKQKVISKDQASELKCLII